MPDETQQPIEEPIDDEQVPDSLSDDKTLASEQSDTSNDESMLMSESPVSESVEDDLGSLADYDLDTEPERPLALNLSIEDETLAVKVILESDLAEDLSESFVLDTRDLDDEEAASADELSVSIEAETEAVTVLSEDELATLESAPSDTTEVDDMPQADVIEEEEIVIKDYLNEDDGEAEEIPDYLQASTPEWKLVAQQLKEEKEAKKRELLERRREEDQRVIEERKAKLDERDEQKRKQEAEFSEQWQQRQAEKQAAVEDMMRRIREERERKDQERANFEEQEFGRKFSYPKPEAAKPYPKPSEIKRAEREQPKNEVDLTDTNKPSPPPRSKSDDDDLDLRVSRLSKPEEPSGSNDKDDSGEKEG